MSNKTGTTNGKRYIEIRIQSDTAKMNKLIDRASLGILTLTGEQATFDTMTTNDRLSVIERYLRRQLKVLADHSYSTKATTTALETVATTIATECTNHEVDADE